MQGSVLPDARVCIAINEATARSAEHVALLLGLALHVPGRGPSEGSGTAAIISSDCLEAAPACPSPWSLRTALTHAKQPFIVLAEARDAAGAGLPVITVLLHCCCCRVSMRGYPPLPPTLPVGGTCVQPLAYLQAEL